MSICAKLAARTQGLKLELIAVALAVRHPRTPWYAKLVAAGCLAYAVTPVDFIPDAVPVVGLIDDLLFIPLALALAVRFIPAGVLVDCRARSHDIDARLPRLSPLGLTLIAAAWAATVVLTALWTLA
jgi:uncharacterized membrane protein YkvA (DUF1232 family)